MKKIIHKNERLITNYGLWTRSTKKVEFTSSEMKFIDYLISIIQDTYLDKEVRSKPQREQEKKTLETYFSITEDGMRTFKDKESVKIEFSYSKVKEFLGLDNKSNKVIDSIIEDLYSKSILYHYENKQGAIKHIITSLNIEEPLIKGKEHYSSLQIDAEFLYINLLYSHYTPLRLHIINKISSKYALRMYQEIEKTLNVGYKYLTSRSLDSMNNYFHTSHNKSEMDRIIVRCKSELLNKKIVHFDYSVEKGENGKWKFSIGKLVRLEEDSNLEDYVWTYFDFLLLNKLNQEKFMNEHSDRYKTLLASKNNFDITRTNRLEHNKK